MDSQLGLVVSGEWCALVEVQGPAHMTRVSRRDEFFLGARMHEKNGKEKHKGSDLDRTRL